MALSTHVRRLALVAALPTALGPATHAGAQGLGAPPETTRPVSSAGMSLFGGWDSSVGLDGLPSDSLLSEPLYSGFEATLAHQRRGPTRGFTAAVGTQYRYFPETRELFNIDGVAELAVDTQVRRHGRLRLSQTGRYTRYRQLNIAPTDTTETDSDRLVLSNPETSSTVGQPFYDLTSAVSFSEGLGPRANLVASYSFRVNFNKDWSERPSMHDVGLRYGRSLSQQTGMWLGSAYRVGSTGIDTVNPSIRATDLQGGVSYSRKGTTLNASSGVTMASRGDTPTAETNSALAYEVTGGAGVTQALGQSWTVRAEYSRRLQFVDALPDPFAADQATGTVSGPLARRVNLGLQASYWTGTAIVTTAGNDQRATGWQAASRLDFNLSRRAQAYVQYHYTGNQFSAGTLANLPAGVVPRSNWGGIRVGLDLWVPFVH